MTTTSPRPASEACKGTVSDERDPTASHEHDDLPPEPLDASLLVPASGSEAALPASLPLLAPRALAPDDELLPDEDRDELEDEPPLAAEDDPASAREAPASREEDVAASTGVDDPASPGGTPAPPSALAHGGRAYLPIVAACVAVSMMSALHASKRV